MNILILSHIYYQGEMAEWFNAAVLKTVLPNGNWGSNPYFSAKLNFMRGFENFPSFYLLL